jgi:hypothetical protein
MRLDKVEYLDMISILRDEDFGIDRRTFDTLNLASSKARERPLMFGTTETRRANRTLQIRNGSTSTRATLAGRRRRRSHDARLCTSIDGMGE